MLSRTYRAGGLLASLILALGLLAPAAFSQTADSVYLNGNILTVNDKAPRASALAVSGDKFIFVGSDKDVKKHIGKSTAVIDLKGKTVLPGLIDSHLHFSGIGEAKLRIDCFWKPKQEILDAVALAYKTAKPGEWLQGRGWNQEVWDPAVFPTKEDLDKIAPNNPVYLGRTDGHAAWVNSKAIELAGIKKDTPNPQGGEILRDAKGEATGILVDTARGLVSSKIPPLSKDRVLYSLELAQEELLSNGVTSAHDAGADWDMIDMLKGLYKNGKLYVRLYERMRIPDGSKSVGDEFYSKKKEIGLFNNSLTIRGIKISLDGALGSRGALMLADYTDRPGSKGLQRITEDHLYNILKRARDEGWQISAHAIGDAANREALDGMERVFKEKPVKDQRWRVEHAQIVAMSDIPRFAQLGVLPSMQTTHATSDKNMAENRVGPERIKGGYAWRSFLNTGVIIPNGTDAPVELVNPFHGLYAGVSRKSRDGLPKGGWYPAESLTREEALKSYTIWGAYAAFEEKLKGSIEKGKLADFIIIDRDYLTCGESEIKDIRNLQTIVGGRVVWPAKRQTP